MTDPFTSDGAKTPPKPFTVEEGRRQVRSFVLRQGRFTPAQQRAFDELWPRFGIDYQGSVRDYDAIFGRSAKRVLEIGFGNGEALRFAAQHDKDRDLIGIEVHAPGVGRLLNALAEDGSDHVRLYHHDAVEVLNNEVADGSLDEVRIYFPDPWHKKRHNKRRLVQPAFADLLVRKLAQNGRLHLATDWQDYAEQMWDVLDATGGSPTAPVRAAACRVQIGARRPISRPAARSSATACGICCTTRAGIRDSRFGIRMRAIGHSPSIVDANSGSDVSLRSRSSQSPIPHPQSRP